MSPALSAHTPLLLFRAVFADKTSGRMRQKAVWSTTSRLVHAFFETWLKRVDSPK